MDYIMIINVCAAIQNKNCNESFTAHKYGLCNYFFEINVTHPVRFNSIVYTKTYYPCLCSSSMFYCVVSFGSLRFLCLTMTFRANPKTWYMFTNALRSMLNCIQVQRGGKRRRKITIKHLYRCEPMHRVRYIYIYFSCNLNSSFFLEKRFRVNVKRRNTLRDQRERVKIYTKSENPKRREY